VTNQGFSTQGDTFFDQAPTTLSAISVSVLPTGSDPSTSGCTPTQDFGIKVAAKYQVFDQSGAAIASSLMEPQETVTNQCINGSCSNPVPAFADIGPSRIIGTSQFTDASGQFTDAPLGICGSIAFNATVTQTIRVLINGTTGYILRTNNFTTTGSATGQGAISNSSDISISRP
jgi:hypothetical protein